MIEASTIVPLREAQDVRRVGGKAVNLARLARLGHPVPDGVVVTSDALSAFLDEHGLRTPIADACASLDAESPERLRAAANRIAAMFRDRDLPPSLAADLDLALASLPPETVIVRSSAIGEDAADASFAGQLDSIGHVQSPAMVRRAIGAVWASRWSARALTYQLARGKSLGGVGVIVQRQITAAASGVIFTVSPNGDDTMTIEYCGGAGEELVSGRLNPGRLTVDRRTLDWREEARPDLSSQADPLLLCDDRLRSLARRALDIEQAFGSPQDIEWTMDEAGRIWIVQARPITVQRPARAAATPRLVIWSNANVNENFPQPITPLLYSIARQGYYHYFRNLALMFGLSKRRVAAMERPLRQIIGVHGARMYYNLSSIHGVLRSAPFGDLLATWFNRFVGAEETDTPAAVAHPLARLRQAGELTVIVARTACQYAFVNRRIERFEGTVTGFAARTHPDRLASKSRAELADDLRAFLDIRCNRWKDASLADTAAMVCYGALERVLRRAFPSEDQAALHNSLLKALPGLPSGLPAVELWNLSRQIRSEPRLRMLIDTLPPSDALDAIRSEPQYGTFAASLDRFLEEWGFRCSGELMLTVKSFQEDPASLLTILQAYVSADGHSPADHLRAQRSERLRETERVAAVLRRRRLHRWLPFVNQWHAVAPLLRSTQHAILLRERARLKQALLYSRLRRVALALGERFVADGRFEQVEDVFFLTASEIDDLATGSEMFPHHVPSLIAARRHAHAELSALTPPDSIALADGDYLPMTTSTQRAPAERGAFDAADRDRSARTLKGLGVCGGTASARAAVLDDVTQSHRLRRGDILVTRQTDPGWGAVFPLISGLVMERGGMLSHGAIIAREFGIPSVVGVADATRIVQHGAKLHIDGDLGTIQVEGEAACVHAEARAS